MVVLDLYWRQCQLAHRRRRLNGGELSFLSKFTVVIRRVPGVESIEDRRCSKRKIVRF